MSAENWDAGTCYADGCGKPATKGFHCEACFENFMMKLPPLKPRQPSIFDDGDATYVLALHPTEGWRFKNRVVVYLGGQRVDAFHLNRWIQERVLTRMPPYEKRTVEVTG